MASLKMTPEEMLRVIDEYCQMGLNSPTPLHWEAALQDILDLIREAAREKSR